VVGKVTGRLFLGNHWLLHVSTKLGTVQYVQINNGKAPCQEGMDIGLSWDCENVRVVARDVQ